jgi:hypothetical protein
LSERSAPRRTRATIIPKRGHALEWNQFNSILKTGACVEASAW